MSTPVRRFGRYELVRKLAAGGMAELYLARLRGEAGFVRDVVVKRLFPHLAEHPPTLRLFQFEALLLAELNHPNIPYVFELGQADGTWYVAMEYIEGYSVTDLWRAGHRAGYAMPLPVALGIVMQACEGLHHAHERRDRAGRPLRIVHRDVTPHNLMVTRDGVVKVLDFGVARTAARHRTHAGTLRGTLAYMAPEQVRGRPVDRRADVFALGVILYELTTGTRLYRGTDVEVMTAIVEHDAPPPSLRVPHYPPALEAIVMHALQRDPRARFSSAAELAAQLEAFALQHGMRIGPRTLAEYVQAVYPAEPVHDESLALVPDESAEWVDEDSIEVVEDAPDTLPPEDYDSVLQDLEELRPPPSASDAAPSPPQPVEPTASPRDASDEVHVPLVRRSERTPTAARPAASQQGERRRYLESLGRRLGEGRERDD